MVAYTLHTLIYGLFKGDIQKGQYITFKDGNEHNINIDNLIVISRNTNKNEITFDKNVRYIEQLKKINYEICIN